MDIRDRDHAIKVARHLLEQYPQAPVYVVQAALLHDSGKALRPYRPLERVLTGLIRLRIPLPLDPLRQDWLGALQIRYYHAEYAARKISDLQVAQIVREHHSPQTLWAKRLHACDQAF
jgi:hypothetical protein